nr:RNA-directed DNA polymerase, eukaryota, reverse transcriptase zinc-binding domain protein [Tanacetum cinerariifolium]
MDMHRLEQKERDSLKQKSRAKWSVEGDENTKFFHDLVNKNRHMKNLNGMNLNGVWVKNPNSIFMAALDHFSSRFHEERPIRPKFRSDNFRWSDREDVIMLESAFTIKEVKAAAWDCSSSKSPGPDDFEKAFDSVNWDFLLDVMAQLNFGSKWCQWIRSCLFSASVSVLINGSPSKEFKMEQCLRQGDPLSPFLFLIVAEALQYADDALFFGEWSKSNAVHLVHILSCFHDVSGLKINLAKSSLFGIGISPKDVVNVARAIRCSHDSLPFTYLGLPVGRNLRKVEAWSDVIDRWVIEDGVWQGKWAWRRQPSGRAEGDLSLLLSLINLTVLDSTQDDRWIWTLNDSGTFSVSSLCQVIQKQMFVNNDVLPPFMWNSWVPRKVNVCTWLLALDRLPTRNNFVRRGVSVSSQSCQFCGMDDESREHCFLSCPIIKAIWLKI